MAADRDTDDLIRIVFIVIAILVLFPLVMMVVAVPLMGSMMMGVGGMTSVSAIVMMIVWLAVLGAIGYVIYQAVGDRVTLPGAGDEALEELRMAYARGDIDEEEFERRREKLQGEDR